MHTDREGRRVIAVVVTHNRQSLLMDCIHALCNQTHRLESIIVIDNNSQDGSAIAVRREFVAKYPVQCCELDSNIGCAGGFSIGMTMAFEANADWIWIMDDDSLPLNDTLSNLLEAQRDDVAVLAPNRVYENGLVQPHDCYWDEVEQQLLPYERSAYASVSPFIVEVTSFVGPLISRSSIFAAGYPLPEMFIHFDDYEYSCRLNMSGKILAVPSAVMIHRTEMPPASESAIRCWTSARRGPWREFFAARNEAYICRSYYWSSRCLWALLRRFYGVCREIGLETKINRARVALIITGVMMGLARVLQYGVQPGHLSIHKLNLAATWTPES